MRNVPILPTFSRSGENLGLARVLLAHGDLAPRLALQTILQAGGYRVDVAASPAEALLQLDECRYELVLSDNRFASDVLGYARIKEYRPATAVVNSSEDISQYLLDQEEPEMSIHTQNLPNLLESIAELIGARARRRARLRPAI